MSNKFVKLPVDIIGTVSDRAAILYALMLDRLELSKQNKQFHDDSGTPFIYFTFADVQERFHIGQAQARATLKELEYAGLIVRKLQGKGNPARTYVTAEKSALQTAEKSALQTAEKSALQTAEKSARNQTDINHTENNQSSSGNCGEICENQRTFDDIFLEMTTTDAVSKIVAQVVSENSREFPEITAKIADFIAENVRNARKNTKIRNLRAYVRACLSHAVTDYNAQQDSSGGSSGGGYGAAYDLAAYESWSAADSEPLDD